MDSPWPWVAVAAAGAVHGLNPATGWAFAAWRAKGARQTLLALAPIGLGHGAPILLLAAAVPLTLQLGVSYEPRLPQSIAAVLLALFVVRHLFGGPAAARPAAGRTGLALWSFIMGSAHGAVPLCAGDMPGREIGATGSLGLALAAVSLHMAAMLITTAAMAAGAHRGIEALREWRRAQP